MHLNKSFNCIFKLGNESVKVLVIVVNKKSVGESLLKEIK